MMRLPLFSAALVAAGFLVSGPEPVHAQSGTTATGTSNELNPAISFNGLFLAGVTDPGSDEDGVKVQGAELALSSIVDPYFRAWVVVGFEPASGSAEAELALEEAWVTALGLPEGVGLKAGRFLLPVGRHNQLHVHQFPFTLAPRAVETILGPHSESDVGVMPSYSLYLPWYANVSAYVTDGASHLFDGDSRELAAGGRLENLWDVSEAATVEAAVSVLNGPGGGEGHEHEHLALAQEEEESVHRRTVFGADARVKWRDKRKTHGRALEWIGELLVDYVPERDDVMGAYTTLLYRFARQWWAGAGYSWDSLVHEEDPDRVAEHEVRGQLGWFPSEFSAVRADVTWTDPAEGDRELSFLLQLNVTLGAHPAHAY